MLHGSVQRRPIMVPNPTEREIKLNRQREALRAATGAWKTENHPELAAGTAGWVRQIRQESVKRSGKIQRHREAK